MQSAPSSFIRGLMTIAFLSLGHFAIAQDTYTAQTDRAALVALYNATDGANWTNKTNWLSEEPLSAWRGVSINHAGRVNSLALYGNNLDGSLPAELGNLSELRQLYFATNSLSGSIPPALGSLDNLQILLLSENDLSGSIPAALADLDELMYIGLEENSLSGSIPTALGGMDSLQYLLLNDNSLSGTVPSELGDLNLAYLYLAGNSLTGCIPVSLASVTMDNHGLLTCASSTSTATATSVPPTNTSLPSTATAIPTDTAIAPSDTPVPTNTKLPPTHTAPPPTQTQTSEPETATTIPLGPPTNLTATIIESGVVLTWHAPAGQVDGYEILRRRPRQGERGLQTYVADTGNSARAYTDSSATEVGERYVYRVKAIRNGIRSEQSNFARADRP